MKRIAGIGSALMTVMLLAGCTDQFYDERIQGYQPELPYQVYPIEVVKGKVRMHLPARGAALTLRERKAVIRLAHDAVSLHTPVVITRPAGSVSAEVRAAEITKLLLQNGVESERIVHRANGGANEITISYGRKIAVTKECGSWTKPLTHSNQNRLYPNFGCAQQHNIAAQVDNPEDFERPRTMDAPDADARNVAMNKYRKAKDYTSTWPGGVKIRINEGLKAQVQR